MIRLTQETATTIVGGANYTWVRQTIYSSGMCDYVRYKHEKDKYGNDTGKMNRDGMELLDCKRGQTFSADSISGY